MQPSYTDRYSGGVIATEDLILSWIGMTILLTIYCVTTKKLFSTKFIDFKVLEYLSENLYRSIWSVLQLSPTKIRKE